MIDSLLKRNPKIHPQLDFPDYKSSILRAPKNKKIFFSSTTSEMSGPIFNKNKIGKYLFFLLSFSLQLFMDFLMPRM